MVNESRHGKNPTKLKPAYTAFLLLPHILNSTKCTALLCLLQQQAQPREGSNKDLQNEQLNMTTDTVTQVRINRTIPGAALRNTFSLLYYTPATPHFCQTGIHLVFSLMLPSPLHVERKRTRTHSITRTVRPVL